MQGVGVVVSGTCLKGVIRVNDTLLLGPNGLGDFIPMPIKSIHRKRMPVREVRGGQTASFALKKIKVHDVRKGQVLVDPSLNPTSCWEFKVRFMSYLKEHSTEPLFQGHHVMFIAANDYMALLIIRVICSLERIIVPSIQQDRIINLSIIFQCSNILIINCDDTIFVTSSQIIPNCVTAQDLECEYGCKERYKRQHYPPNSYVSETWM